MTNYLGLFNTQEEFSAGKGNLEEPWVAYVMDTQEVFYKDIEQSDAAGTIVLGNSSGARKYVSPESYDAAAAEADGYTPIGIVVIPKSHTEDGKGRMMSIDLMSLINPNNGTKEWNVTGDTDATIMAYYGGYGTDVESLTNYTQVATIGTSDNIAGLGDTQTLVLGNPNDCLIASNIYETKDGSESGITTDGMICIYGVNPYDPETKWAYFNQGSIENPGMSLLPSPYLSDGSINTVYRTSGTATSDMDGQGNTEKLLALATGQSDWQTADTITNDSGATYYPAACCCWRYSTIGTSQGDWYLPAYGELGYLAARAKQIQAALKSIGGFDLVGEENIGMGFTADTDVLSLIHFWSSSEYSSDHAYDMSTDGTSMIYGTKRSDIPVVAFSPAF